MPHQSTVIYPLSHRSKASQQHQNDMALPFRVYLALLALVSFVLSPVLPLAVDVQPPITWGPEPTLVAIPGTNGKPTSEIQPIDPPARPVPTKLPVPTGEPKPIDTGITFQVNTGKPFFIRLDSFLKILGDGTKVSTSPGVSWVTLDLARRAIAGTVPVDYPASRITVALTVRYTIGGRVVNLGFSVTLEVRRPVSISAPKSTSTPTAPPTISLTSLAESIRTTTPTTITSASPTAASAVATLVAGWPFEIPLAPFLRNATNRVNSLHTDPVSPWVGFKESDLSQALVGVVPADLPDQTLAINLYIVDSTFDAYTLTLSIVVRAASGSLPSSTTTAPLGNSTTIPSEYPSPTLIQGQRFGISFDPYKRQIGDIVTSFSTDPQTDWNQFNVPPPFRPSSLQGTVPDTQPPGTIAVTLTIYSRVAGFNYIVPFTIVVREDTMIFPA